MSEYYSYLRDTALVDRLQLSKSYKTTERILPLKECFVQTDRLIDAVMYHLYELTTEEIRVVEGRV